MKDVSVLLSRVHLLQLGIFDGGFLSPLVHHRPCLKGTQRILQVQCKIMICQAQNNCCMYSSGIQIILLKITNVFLSHLTVTCCYDSVALTNCYNKDNNNKMF